MATAEQKINTIFAFEHKVYESAELMQTIIDKIADWGSDLPDDMKRSFYSEGIMRDMNNLLYTLQSLKPDIKDARSEAKWYIGDDKGLLSRSTKRRC